MTNGRVLYMALDILDRQLVDRNDVLCGNVDDIEISRAADGAMYATAIFTGPGALAYRLGGRRLGRWLTKASIRLSDSDEDRTRIPMELADDISQSIHVAVDAADLASHDIERWVRRHVVEGIPGSDARARQ